MTEKWWGELWTCPACRTTTTKHHRTRHIKTQGHLDRVRPSVVDLPTLSSHDLEFTKFLAGLNARTFRGEERKLYDAARLHRKSRS